jgi:hypothetical protein
MTTESENIETDGEIAPGPELLLNAEIFLPRGDCIEIARVIALKWKADGFFSPDGNTKSYFGFAHICHRVLR